MLGFVSGAIAMGFLVAAVFFLKFWRKTSDMLFAFFGLAFLTLSLNQTLTAFARVPLEERTWLYLLRLVAFTLILIGILVKNRQSKHPKLPGGAS
jgi:membrane protein CcdC involved in cytochrome C biogenesis